MSALPETNADYGTHEYWNSRFATEENYEWCKGYEEFRSYFNQYVPKNDRILIVGKSELVKTVMFLNREKL